MNGEGVGVEIAVIADIAGIARDRKSFNPTPIKAQSRKHYAKWGCDGDE